MSNDISLVKNVIDKQPHKVSVSNDVSLNLKQKFMGTEKNQEKFLITRPRIVDFKNLKVNFPESNSSSRESESEEKISKGDNHSNVV